VPISLSSTKARWLILLSFVALLLIVAPEPNDTLAVEALHKGVPLVASDFGSDTSMASVFARRHDVESAYQHVLTRRPIDPQPWRLMGDLNLALGRTAEAQSAYTEARKRGDETAALDRSLARLYAMLGDSRKAIEHWSRYLARRPDDDAARWALIWVSIGRADWERARTELEYLLDVAPTDPVANAWLGLLLIGRDAIVGAQHLESAIKDPEMAAVLAPLLDAERQSSAVNDPAYRSAAFGAALSRLDASALNRVYRPDSDQPYLIAEQGVRKAILTLALRSLLTAVNHNPDYADAYAYLGEVLDHLGWSGWAQASLQRALQLAPESPLVQTFMGLYWNRHGSHALARSYFESALLKDSDNADLGLQLAESYLAEGEYTAAEIWLLFAVDVAPDDPQVWEAMARFYTSLGIGTDASGLLAARRLVEMQPQNARAHDLMGWAYFLSDENALARISLRQALAIAPNLASAHYHLGRLNTIEGRFTEAAQDYLRATEYDVDGRLATQLQRAWGDLPLAYQEQP
jgi:tetratricopeptide (TPR) repeat protein